MRSLNSLESWDHNFFLVRFQILRFLTLRLTSWCFPCHIIASYGPSYNLSFKACIGLLAGAIVGVVASEWLMKRAASRKESLDPEAGPIPGVGDPEK